MLTNDRIVSPPSHGRVEMLDLLRLVAVLAVVVFHYAFRGAAADDTHHGLAAGPRRRDSGTATWASACFSSSAAS